MNCLRCGAEARHQMEVEYPFWECPSCWLQWMMGEHVKDKIHDGHLVDGFWAESGKNAIHGVPKGCLLVMAWDEEA